jgi:isopenicillin N synthase-like dioxygenase
MTHRRGWLPLLVAACAAAEPEACTPAVLPVLDLADADERAFARELDAACRDHGFVALRNVGVDRALLAAAWNASEALFAMKSEDKARLEPWAAATNRGYSPPGRERLNARRKTREPKEAFNVKRAGNAYDRAPAGFGPVADELWRVLVVEAAKRYAVAAALALDLPRDFFSKTLRRLDLCTLRFLHYPALPPSPEELLRAGEHTDFGFVTFLFVKGGAAGLQMKSVDGGEVVADEAGGWRDVVVPADDDVVAVVNTGALLARWTNDRWRATAHRVVAGSKGEAPRYAIAAFIDPDADAEVAAHPSFGASRYPPTTGLAFLRMKLDEANA